MIWSEFKAKVDAEIKAQNLQHETVDPDISWIDVDWVCDGAPIDIDIDIEFVDDAWRLTVSGIYGCT